MNSISNSQEKDPLELLSDCASNAHARIQSDFSDINPVVGVSRKLRGMGINADTMTIDCLKSGKRIIIILQDEMPAIVRFQFSYIEQDPADEFELLALSELSDDRLYEWMKNYFS
ncbi:hypothetical protein [Agaribacterium sp. ZY112]|uniref:hypothetical protein n=1 Tax=Agaribacterium sp. ZY112 TaxID=3233574 RepID=UPI00352444C5